LPLAPSSSLKEDCILNSGALHPRTLDADRPATIAALLHRSVERSPDADAIAMIGEVLSYRQLERRTTDMAAALVAAGAGKGTRIALLAPDGILWATIFLAATRIGALVIAVSTHATAPELAHILRHSDTQILIGVRRFLRHDYADRLQTAFPGLAAHKAGPLYLTDAPFLRSVWLDNVEGLGWAASYDDLLGRPAPADSLIAAMETEVAPSDAAVIIYTSGSSSLPKAVVHTHRSAAQHSQVLAEYFHMRAEDRLMPLLPLFWVGGLTMLLEVMASGGTLVYPRSPGLADVIAAIRQLRVNRINSWGPQTEKVRAALTAVGIDPNSIGGLTPQCDAHGMTIAPGRVANMLGMTESFGPHSAEPTGTVLSAVHHGASGRATSDYERRIVDPETGTVLATGQSGELQLRRGGLMQGFYKTDPDHVFTPDGFYPTGDTARIDVEGYLYFEGRRSDMMKTGGVNVSRMEVEGALRTLPEVALPIVLPLSDPTVGQIVVAAVVPAAGAAPTEDGLKAALRKLVASYKIPQRILVIEEGDVQWTPSNKIKVGEMATLIAERIGHEAIEPNSA
jgi:acyl-CoA synthetase (AMP-forming)/AMP-acid ligase II